MNMFFKLFLINLGLITAVTALSDEKPAIISTNTIDPVFGAFWDLDNAEAGPNQTQPDDRLGEAIVTGDFNGDGRTDIAIGIPNRSFIFNDAGAVLIMYGDDFSFSSENSIVIFGNTLDDGDHFGNSLTSGDFNNDGYDDLVVGTPNKNYTNPDSMIEFDDTGAVYVYYGTPSGIAAPGRFIDADENAELGSDRQEFGYFGRALSSGDYDGDGFDDLVVSATGQNISGADNAGMIFIYYGGQVISGNMGLYSEIRDSISQATAGIMGSSETGDNFGFSLATGDFNNNGYDDLAIGVPYEDVGTEALSGLVQVIYGDTTGLTTDDEYWEQSDIIGAVTEPLDIFGYALAAADINGDGNDDLVIGAPFEDVGGVVDAGAAHLMLGSINGLTTVGSLTFSQQTTGIAGTAETSDRFGYSVGAADLDSNGQSEVLIGVPFESFNGSESGYVHIIPGIATGLDFNESSVLEGQSAGDNWGYDFAVSEYYYGPNLIVSAPGNTSNDSDLDAGAVNEIFYLNPDIIFKDGFDFSPIK